MGRAIFLIPNSVGNLCLSNLRRSERNRIKEIPAFQYMKDAIHRHVAEVLPEFRNRPPYLEVADGSGQADANMLAHGVAAKAGDRTDCAIDRSFAALLLDGDFDTRAIGGTIGLYALQQQRDRVIAVPRIAIERGQEDVAGKGPAQLLEDVFEELGGAFPGDVFLPTLYRNPGHGNHSITLLLEGVKTNRAAYGARIKVTIEEQGRERSIYRAVGSVSSFGGNPMRQHIGVGLATSIRDLEIWWPVSKLRQHFSNVPVDRVFHILEGRDLLDPVALRPSEIGKTQISH